jgi:SAM-dependent methyltransferase
LDARCRFRILHPVRRHAPATLRNREPILGVLRELLPEGARVLEVASGTGEHAAAFARALPGVTWQPSDVDPGALASIEAWRKEAGAPPNLRPAIALDAAAPPWGMGPVEAVVAINLVHIAPWPTVEGLFEGAAQSLGQGGVLFLYGPYRFDGAFTAPSNAAFDASLRAEDPAWGVRDVADLTELALLSDLAREAVVAMPANNHVLVFRRR